MRLPAEDLPFLPEEDTGPLVVDNTEPVAATWDEEELLRFLPAWAREGEAELRDAMMQAWGAIANTLWASISRTYAAQTSPLNATGADLDAAHGIPLRLPRSQGEDHTTYRNRLMSATPTASLEGIRGVVNPLSIADTGSEAAVIEPAVDAAFASDPSQEWTAFAQGDGPRLWAYDPTRPDDRTAGAYSVSAVASPMLWIVLPGDALDDSQVAFATSGSGVEGTSTTSFLANTTAEWAFAGAGSDSLIYRVNSAVARAVLGGVPVLIFTDAQVAGGL